MLPEDVTLTEIGHRCGVGRAAASAWRRRSLDRWPAPVGGDERSPRFFWPDLAPVLIADGHLRESVASAPALVTLPDGMVLLLHSPTLLKHSDGWQELSGDVERTNDLPIPWPHADIEAEIGGERFTVARATVDISSTGSEFFLFVRFDWPPARQSPGM